MAWLSSPLSDHQIQRYGACFDIKASVAAGKDDGETRILIACVVMMQVAVRPKQVYLKLIMIMLQTVSGDDISAHDNAHQPV